jgi:hypothetical protein
MKESGEIFTAEVAEVRRGRGGESNKFFPLRPPFSSVSSAVPKKGLKWQRMWKAFRDLDRILRGDATRLPVLRSESLGFPLAPMSFALLLLAAAYGVCMGAYAVFRPSDPSYPFLNQLFATTVKVPLLFILTLVVTFPSLYVFSALMGSRLTVPAVLRLLVASLGVNLAVLASLGPIVAFFAVSTTNYLFMVVLNVAVFAVAGGLGLLFLLRTLHRMSYLEQELPPRPLPPVATTVTSEGESEVINASLVEDRAAAFDRLDDRRTERPAQFVFRAWIFLFGLVGAQMGWVLRPFIGSGNEFVWFRERKGNFFESVSGAIMTLLSG